MIKSWDELPLILNTQNLRAIMQGDTDVMPSKDAIQKMMHSENFPLIKGAKELKVGRDAFKEWLMNPKIKE